MTYRNRWVQRKVLDGVIYADFVQLFIPPSVFLISKMRHLDFPSMVRQKLHHERKIKGSRCPSPFALKPVNGLGLKHLANQIILRAAEIDRF